jgi:hypothetical protein
MITSPIHEDNDPQTSSVGTLNEVDFDPRSLEVTAPFVGKWNTLISQTNWEKGRIISEWRSALVDSGAQVQLYSDESWSRQVGAVTSQHVGRLRRVYERFGSTQTSYSGLYWSHFLAALDWDDAELWLEGAVRSGWSIAEMRKTRWETSGGDPKHTPRDEEMITTELDDGFEPLTSEDESDVESDRSYDDSISSGKTYEDADFGDSDAGNLDTDSSGASAMQSDGDVPWNEDGKQVVNPFASLPELPPDVADALEQFKLCIVRHRSTQWADMSQKAMLDVVDALRLFALK